MGVTVRTDHVLPFHNDCALNIRLVCKSQEWFNAARVKMSPVGGPQDQVIAESARTVLVDEESVRMACSRNTCIELWWPAPEGGLQVTAILAAAQTKAQI